MLKKRMKYIDFDGNEREEDFYFNLTKAEIAEMDLTTEGGMIAMLNRIIAAQDVPSLVAVFKELIAKSYGIKSPDGRRFMKSPEIFADFAQTEAYSNLFMELAFDAEAAAAFVNGIAPEVKE